MTTQNSTNAENHGTATDHILDNTLAGLVERTVIVDTSSLLISGTSLLGELPPCELVIPSVVVSELEDKRGDFTLGFMAREWLRFFEEVRVTHGESMRTGVLLDEFGHEGLRLRVEPNHKNQSSLPTHLQDGSNDSTILAVAKNFVDSEFDGSTDDVVVLSNDVPMRLHATLNLRLNSVGYDYASVKEGAVNWNGFTQVYLSNEQIADIYTDNAHDISAHDLPNSIVEIIHEKTADVSWAAIQLILEEAEHTIAYLLKTPVGLDDLDYHVSASGIIGKTVEQRAALSMLSESPSVLPITSVGGNAGTGKTLLALAAGVDGVHNELYEKVLVLRSLHEMGNGQEMGFLPGDANEKMQPWAGAVADAMDAIEKNEREAKLNRGHDISAYSTETDTMRSYVEVSPITYLRGRSLSNAYIIIEEAQNFSRSELLNILSRIGEGSKVVLTFDASQVDNKFLQSGDKADVWGVIDRFKSSALFAHVTLRKTERSVVAQLASDVLENG